MTKPDYLQEISRQYPNVRPGQEKDSDWYEQGMEHLEAGRSDRAEELFKKLSLSQPEHSDGFQGLGMLYARKGDTERARFFYDEAIRRAEVMVRDGDMDREYLEMIRSEREELSES